MSQYPKGSEWRKWDLHIHSTYSQEHSAKLSHKDIFQAAVEHDISVISITDHSNVDGLDEAWAVWESGSDNNGNKYSEIISFFPGVELKASAGNKGVHFLAVFPPVITSLGYEQRVDQSFLKEALLAKIGCSKSEIKAAGGGDYKQGLFQVAVNFEKAAELVRGLGGLIIVHHGNKANSLEEEINHPPLDATSDKLLNTLGTHKEKLMRECVDICELPNWSDYHQRQEKFYRETFSKPSVIFSDSHASYENSCPTWIKADPTFEGLKQVLHEPEDRIWRGSNPPSQEYIKQNKHSYIDSVVVKPVEGATGWFNSSLSLNHHLVAVIGNKGSGKSALADIISLLGNTKQFDKFSFLQAQKFRNKKTGKAGQFQAEMSWLDGNTAGPVTLDENPQSGSVEKLRYLPQDFIDEICTDLSSSRDSQFYKELEEVIYSHLPEHKRLGCDSLADLLKQEGQETERLIQAKIEKIAAINGEIVNLQRRLQPEAKSELDNRLAERERIASQICHNKPRQPTKLNTEDQEQQKIIDRIACLQQRADKLRKFKDEFESQRIAVSKDIALCVKLNEHLAWVKAEVESIHQSVAELAMPLGIDPEKLFRVKINPQIIQSKKEELFAQKQSLDDLLNPKIDFSLEWELGPLIKTIQSLHNELDKPEKEQQEYLQMRRKWKKRLLAEFGSKEDPQPDTIRRLRQELAEFVKIPERLEELTQERRELAVEIFSLKNTLKEKFRLFHAPVQQFISEHPIAQREQFPLSFRVSITEEDFANIFFEHISHGVNGSFCGSDQGKERLADILDRTDFDSQESVLAFLDEILAALREDKRSETPVPMTIDKQLRKNNTEEKLLNMLFSLSYLKPVYNLQWDSKGVDQLSPGERGQLLLIFYLLIDRDHSPLIIDQPEENLDNETVYKVLVPCIKEAKNKRQVIMVTHNPNLAVVCDAEQVIHVAMDKKNDNAITYTSGAIENPEINRMIVDVLEGTKPAFTVRESKYQFASKA